MGFFPIYLGNWLGMFLNKTFFNILEGFPNPKPPALGLTPEIMNEMFNDRLRESMHTPQKGNPPTIY